MATVTILTLPEISVDTVEVQMPDGLDILRAIPRINQYVPRNCNPITRFAGRMDYSSFLIESDTLLELEVKFDLTVDNKSYLGIMPVCQMNDSAPYVFEAVLDCIKEGDIHGNV